MLGETLASMGLDRPLGPLKHVGVKESVFPFNRFPGTDAVLGPEMKSTGEVMGISSDLGIAFAKSQIAAGMDLPTGGVVFVSVKDSDKPALLPTARRLVEMGFSLLATDGTSAFLAANGVPHGRANKVSQGRPHIVDAIKNDKIALIINTPSGRRPRADEAAIRISAVAHSVPLVTTVMAAQMVADGIAARRKGPMAARSIQEYLAETPTAYSVKASPPGACRE
jgi:carbamoyl-phosphate synthase large subunit